LRDQQAEEVANVGDLDRALTGGQITPDVTTVGGLDLALIG
jgi:hypothetical protein